jgi:hypothetical protein
MDAVTLYLQTYLGFPSLIRGFDSPLPLHVFNKLRPIADSASPLNAVIAVTSYFGTCINKGRNAIECQPYRLAFSSITFERALWAFAGSLA